MDFKIYKIIRQEALDSVNAKNDEEFAGIFAADVAKHAGVLVKGIVQDGFIHLIVDDSDMISVSDELEKRGLSHRF